MQTLAAAVAIALLVPSAALRAESGASKRRELGEIQKEISATREEIEQYRRQEQGLSLSLKQLENHSVTAQRRLSDLRRSIQGAEKKKAELKSRLGALKMASGRWRDVLGGEVRLYRAEALSREESYGTIDLWKQSFERAAILDKAALLARMEGFSRKTEAAAAENRRKAEDMMAHSRRVSAEQEDRERELKKKKEAIAQTQEKAVAATRHAKDLEESAKALTELIKELGKKTGRYYRKGGATLDIARHSLPWPAEGQVAESFGREKHPQLGTWVIHQGLKLRTSAEAAVSAVAGGRVIFAGPFRSYGQVVILDHGSAFFTIYGELGKILREKGEQVQAGERVATAGAAKAGGGVLYLEMRRGSEALDPLIWLKRK